MERLILSVVGNPGSGKTSVACKHLADNYNFAVARPSDIIREYAHEYDLPLYGRPDFIKTHLRIIENLGELYIPQRILGSSESHLCVDGERVPPYVDYYRQFGAKVIAMWCPQGIRFERSLARADAKDKPDREAFARDEAAEYEADNPYAGGTMTIMRAADYHIDASQPELVVTAQLDEIVVGLLAK